MRNACLVLAFIVSGCLAWGEYPSIVIGLGGEPVLQPDPSGTAEWQWAAEAEGSFSLRTMLGERAYAALLLRGRGGAVFSPTLMGLDEEILSAELGFAWGEGKLAARILDHSSFSGTLTDAAFHVPEWELTYHFTADSKTVNPYLSYAGFIRLRPEDAQDAFSEQVECGLEWRPSVLEEYRLSLSAGWNLWYETYLYTSGGVPGSLPRHDGYGEVTGRIGGIIDYFFNWNLELSFKALVSNANTYLTVPAFLNEGSENAFISALHAGFDWSPHSSLTITLSTDVAWKPYWERRAVDATGALTGDLVYVFSLGGEAELIWAPVAPLQLVARFKAEWYFSNEDALKRPLFQGYAGIKFNL